MQDSGNIAIGMNIFRLAEEYTTVKSPCPPFVQEGIGGI